MVLDENLVQSLTMLILKKNINGISAIFDDLYLECEKIVKLFVSVNIRHVFQCSNSLMDGLKCL